MATLPTPGSDEGTWGTELNTYLRVGHRANGTHDDPMCNENQVVCNLNQVVVNQTDFSTA